MSNKDAEAPKPLPVFWKKPEGSDVSMTLTALSARGNHYYQATFLVDEPIGSFTALFLCREGEIRSVDWPSYLSHAMRYNKEVTKKVMDAIWALDEARKLDIAVDPSLLYD